MAEPIPRHGATREEERVKYVRDLFAGMDVEDVVWLHAKLLDLRDEVGRQLYEALRTIHRLKAAEQDRIVAAALAQAGVQSTIVLEHPAGGRAVIELPMLPDVVGHALEALGALGFTFAPAAAIA